MCIIIYKPKEVNMPKPLWLENSFDNNSDGAGFMYLDKGKVQIRKGFMHFSEFLNAWNDIPDKSTEGPVIAHFRITTHAGVKPEITHPYPLSNSYTQMKKLEQACRVGVVHNGTLNVEPEDKTVNDTMAFVKYALWRYKDSLFDYNLMLEMAVESSRLALMREDGEVRLIGKFEEDAGLFLSNNSYRYSRYTSHGFGVSSAQSSGFRNKNLPKPDVTYDMKPCLRDTAKSCIKCEYGSWAGPLSDQCKSCNMTYHSNFRANKPTELATTDKDDNIPMDGVEKTSQFCDKCIHNDSTEFKVCVECDDTASEFVAKPKWEQGTIGTMMCAACGNHVEESDDTCDYCGVLL